jgi:hypothetical protein
MLEAPLPDDLPLPGLDPVVLPTPPASARSGAAPAEPALQDTVAAHHAKADRRPPDTIWRANPREQA